jgi:4'-phosphopantetheinyl transferase
MGRGDAWASAMSRILQAWPCLAREEVHVWRAPLDLRRVGLARLRDLLSTEERALSLTFRFQWERDRFVAARGWLRLLLGRYLCAPPGGLRFVIRANGKPALAEPASEVRFNLALAGPLALMAVCEGREVGMAVEPVSEDASGPGARTRFTSVAGGAEPLPLAAERQDRALLEDRARREAYHRARGWPSPAEVRRGPAPPSALGEGGEAAWSFHAVDAGPGYTGALALEGTVRLVRHLDCDPRWLDGWPLD